MQFNTSWKGATTKTVLKVPYHYKITKNQHLRKIHTHVFLLWRHLWRHYRKNTAFSGIINFCFLPNCRGRYKMDFGHLLWYISVARNNITHFKYGVFEILWHLWRHQCNFFMKITKYYTFSSSQMAVVARKWTSVTFYDIYLLWETILPILNMAYLRFFDIYDVISVIFDENT